MPGTGVTSGTGNRSQLVTIAKWFKKLNEETVQKYALLALLKKKGCIHHHDGGGELRWVFKYKDHDLEGYVDGDAVTWNPVKTVANANLPWRGYQSKDIVTRQEKLENSGRPAQVRLFSGRGKLIRDGLIRQMGKKFWQDGNATGNEREFHGIESFMSWTTQTASDRLATTLNDTYAGQSTSYTAFKSNAQKNVDEEYGVWSPVLVNTNRTPSGGSLRDWEDYADEYVRYGLLEAKYGSSREDRVDTILMTKDAFEKFLNIADDKERIHVTRGSDLSLVSLGFEDAIKFDGCEILWDFGIPTTDSNSDTVHGYGFNTDKLSLEILGNSKGKTIFGMDMDFDINYGADKFYFWLIGNLKFESPRHFIKFADIS